MAEEQKVTARKPGVSARGRVIKVKRAVRPVLPKATAHSRRMRRIPCARKM